MEKMINYTRKGKQFLYPGTHIRVGVGKHIYYGDLVDIYEIDNMIIGRVKTENGVNVITRSDTVKVIGNAKFVDTEIK